MRSRIQITGWVLAVALACVWSTRPTNAADGPTTAEEVKMRMAMPTQPRVKPTKPRKLLVFCRSWGYKHSAIPYGSKMAELMGPKSGAFEAVVTTETELFEPQNLAQFDAVLFNNTNNEIFLPEDFDKLSASEQATATARDQMLKKAFVEWLSGGKGLAVIHAGVASFREWPEFGEIIGARFDNHPWNAGSTVTVRVEEPDHPLTQAFEEPLFDLVDEVYQVKAPYSRDNVRVLLSLDPARTKVTLNQMAAIHRTDKDFAQTWIKTYGQGRVFYCAFGHQHELFWNPMILEHFLDGIQYALGDLRADATPSSKVQKKQASR